MPYAFEDDLRRRLGPEEVRLLGDDAGTGDAIPALIEAALDDASAEMDAVIAARYITPVASEPAPRILLRLNVDLAIYFLYLRRREAIPRETADRVQAARGQLDAIAEGRLVLEGAILLPRPTFCESTTRDQPRRFDRGRLEPF